MQIQMLMKLEINSKIICKTAEACWVSAGDT